VHHELVLDSAGAGAFIILGSLLMLYFPSKEGQRYFRVHSEMRLAADIHRALVPEISRRVGNFEFYGASVPSGAVGGDLLDAADNLPCALGQVTYSENRYIRPRGRHPYCYVGFGKCGNFVGGMS
jgi:hypothetical protein